MKSELEIQRAHDLLTGAVTGLGPVPADVFQDEVTRMLVVECISVLCWALGHHHTQGDEDSSFGAELERLEQYLQDQGIVVLDAGRPLSHLEALEYLHGR